MISNHEFNLVLLKTGETLKSKAEELIDLGFKVATMDEVEDWMVSNKGAKTVSPITIADPMAKPNVHEVWPGLTLVQVRAYAIDRGVHYPKGWIDLDVPMWPKEAGGQLAILTIVSYQDVP